MHLSHLQSRVAAALTGLLRSFRTPSLTHSRPRTQDPGPLA
jgi:hypothetical protein